jgi:hypothetical protein
MDFAKYENEDIYPLKSAFQTKFWYKSGVTVAKRGPDGVLNILVPNMTEADVIKIKTFETDIDVDALATARHVYAARAETLRKAFKADLFAELGIEENPKRELLFTKACEDTQCFSEIENRAWDLVDLIK